MPEINQLFVYRWDGVFWQKVAITPNNNDLLAWDGSGHLANLPRATFAAAAHASATNNPHGVTKAQVGLGNCDNTSDANKPVSTAQAAAIAAAVAAVTAAPLVRVTGTLQGYTDAGHAAAAPDPITFALSEGVWDICGTVITVATVNPEDGTTYFDSNPGMASVAVSVVGSLSIAGVSLSHDGTGNITVESTTVGAAASINVNGNSSAGQDEVLPSGDISTVVLYTVPTGKKFRAIAAYVLHGADLSAVPKIISGASVIALSDDAVGAKALTPGDAWASDVNAGGVIWLLMDEGTPEGGTATVQLIGELVAA